MLNSSTDTSAKQEVIADLESLDIGEDYLFTTEDVQNAIDGLKKGKAAGMDGISTEHFIYASDKA